MSAIWKYQLQVTDEQTITIPSKGTQDMIKVIVKKVPSDEKTPGPHLNFIQEFDVGQQPYDTEDPRLIAVTALKESLEQLGNFEVLSIDRDHVIENLDDEQANLDDEKCDDIAANAAMRLGDQLENLGIGDAIDEATEEVLRDTA